MQGDGGDHREEHAVGRRPQAGVPDALNRDGHEAGHGARPQPEDRRPIAAKARREKRQAGGDGDRGRDDEHQPAFGGELQVLVVGVIEEELTRAEKTGTQPWQK